MAVILIDIAINIPFATFLMKNSISTVPIELEEAARIDGTVIFFANTRKRCYFAGSISEYRTVFNGLDKSVSDDGAWSFAIINLLFVYAKIYNWWGYGWFCKRITL